MRVRDAADDLHGSGIALLGKRDQVLEETRLVAMERLENCHRQRRWRVLRLREAADQGRCSEQITTSHDRDEQGCDR
jgi:hypothetical protein